VNKPWLRRGTWMFEDAGRTHRTAGAVLRGIESAYGNSELWDVSREGDGLVLARQSPTVSVRLWWWFRPETWEMYRSWIETPAGVVRASFRAQDLSRGVGVEYELDCARSFAAIALLDVLIIGILLSDAGSSWTRLVLGLLVPISVIWFLTIPRRVHAYILRSIDRPTGPRDSLLDILTR
jgi:hypothetical protein